MLVLWCQAFAGNDTHHKDTDQGPKVMYVHLHMKACLCMNLSLTEFHGLLHPVTSLASDF